MRAPRKTPKLPYIETALALLAVGLVGFVAVYVLNAKQNANELLNEANSATAQPVSFPKTGLQVAATKLPAGWQTTSSNAKVVNAENIATKCRLTATYEPTTTTVSTLASTQQPETVSDLTNQGYSVTNQGQSSRQTMATSDGVATISGQTYRTAQAGNVTYQNFGYIATDGEVATTQLSCPKQTDITAATAALQAVTFKSDL